MNKLISNKNIVYIISIFILFIIPIYTIAVNSNTLKGGTEYLFKVEIFDPYDMFRGNYLNIRFKESSVSGKSVYLKENSKDEYFVTIGIAKDGFAYFKSISESKPVNTSNYFKTTGYYNKYSNTYTIDTPTRYYMNENKSEMSEKIYRDNIDNAYVKVRVKNGKMVIIGVYVDNILIDSID